MSRMLPDVVSGFLVSLIALPLCLGIALASGFPPIAGVVTAIVGGLVVSFVGHADLTIKGPAAGLIVIVLGAVTELGQGDPVAGYRRALAVGVVAALLQIAFALARTSVLAKAVPSAVVRGMLTAIGLLIMVKQLPIMLGAEVPTGGPLAILLGLPAALTSAHPAALALGLGAPAPLLVLPRIRPLRRVPAPVLVVLASVPLATALGLTPSYRVALPSSLTAALTFPDFSLVAHPTSIKYIVMLAVVGSLESLLSVLAIDGLTPARRPSNLDRDLLATGLGNLLSSFVGGLPMISEIVRSKANLDAKATSKWSNAWHGLFLLLAVGALPGLIQHIPLAVLAAMLVYTGARLASPREFQAALRFGPGQLLAFLVTIAVTLTSDLLLGIGAGLLTELALHLYRGARPADLFRSPAQVQREGHRRIVQLRGPAAFTNLLPLKRALGPDSAQEVWVDATHASLVARTVLERIDAAAAAWPNTSLRWIGLEELTPQGREAHSTRLARRRPTI